MRKRKNFGANEYGLEDAPSKVSNVFMSRLVNGEKMGCSWCFPHGFETINSRYNKVQRSWKKHRKTQWK